MSNFTPEQIQEILDIFFDNFAHRQYIGQRYVPIFGRKDEESIIWDNSGTYEPLTIVLYQGNSYTSRQFVPEGVDITNLEYWANTGNYNAQVEAYRQEVQTLANMLPDNEFDSVNTVKKYIDDVANMLPETEFDSVNTVKKYIDDADAFLQGQIGAGFSDSFSVKNAVDILYAEKAQCFNTVQDMKDYAGLQAGMICHTNGFHTSDDGGAVWYEISDSGTANEMDVITCGDLFAHMIVPDVLKPEMFGAYGDGINDDSTVLQYCFNLDKKVVLSKTYATTAKIVINKDVDTVDNGAIKAIDTMSMCVEISPESNAVQQVKQFYRLNVDANAKADIGIGVGLVKGSRLNLSVSNSISVGIQASTATTGNNENIFNCNVYGQANGNSVVGVLINCYDSVFESINVYDCLYSAKLKSGMAIINNLHGWLKHPENYWTGSATLWVDGVYTAIINWLFQDGMQYGIKCNGIFGYVNFFEELQNHDADIYTGMVNVYNTASNNVDFIVNRYSGATAYKMLSYYGLTNASRFGVRTNGKGIVKNNVQNETTFTDIDNAPQIGTFYVKSSITNLPRNTNSVCELKIIGNQAIQEVTCMDNGAVYRRIRELGTSTWGNWLQYTLS